MWRHLFLFFLSSILFLSINVVVSYSEPSTTGLHGISEGLKDFGEAAKNLLVTLKDVSINILKAMGGALVGIGLVLWASDLHPYKGKKLALTGLVLMLLLSLINF